MARLSVAHSAVGALRVRGSVRKIFRCQYHRQSDRLARYRHPRKADRRTVPGFFRTCFRACRNAWRDVCSYHA
jgi:hypothetical protein